MAFIEIGFNTKRPLILGRGGFGTQLNDWLMDEGWGSADFLDDNAPDAVGGLRDYVDPAILKRGRPAFVALGDNKLRVELLQKLASAGYSTPVFISDAASVSPSAVLEPGCIILPQAYVGANAHLGVGCIVNAGAIVDHNAHLGRGVHVAPGGIVKASAEVADFGKVDSGEIVRSPWENQYYIDELKGLGILLVVLGHFIEQYRMGYSFVSASFFCIYAFHMALFCICSGLVARFNPRKLVTQQLWLYLVGQTLMLAFRAAVLRENFAETGGLLAAWLLPWRHIWYLYALIFWHLTLPVLCRLRDRLGLAGSCLGMALAVGLALAAGLVDWPFTLVRVFAFYPFYACGVLLRPQLDRLAAFAAEHRAVRLVAAAGLVLGYGTYFLWVLRADPIMDHSAELFHDVSYAGGDRVQYRVVFYLVGIATTAALTVLASRWHLLAGLGRHTLAIYLLHLPVQALLVELGLYDLMRGKATIVVVLWSVLLAAVTLAVLNLSPVQRACDAVANCWYKRK